MAKTSPGPAPAPVSGRTATIARARQARAAKALERYRNTVLVEQTGFTEDLVNYLLEDPEGSLREFGPAAEIVLFGSRACMQHRPDSDWDVMVFVERDDDLLAWGVEEEFADSTIHVAYASAHGTGMTHRVIREEQLTLWTRERGLAKAKMAGTMPEFVLTDPVREQAEQLAASTGWSIIGLLDKTRLLLWDNRHASFGEIRTACSLDGQAIPFTLHTGEGGISLNVHESLSRRLIGDPTLAATIRSHPGVQRLGPLRNLNFDGLGKGDPDQWAAAGATSGPRR